MNIFSCCCTMDYVEQPSRTNRQNDTAGPSTSTDTEPTIGVNGNQMALYKYLLYCYTNGGFSDEQSMRENFIVKNNQNFIAAYSHPQYGQMIQKVMENDKVREQAMNFDTILDTTNLSRFDESNRHYNLVTSHELLDKWCDWHQIDKKGFVLDIYEIPSKKTPYEILSKKTPKKNTLVLRGPSNSGKSYIARSISSIYKYSATVQGTANFPFIEPRSPRARGGG